MKQQNVFQAKDGGTINVYQQSNPLDVTGKKTESQNVKLTPELKEWANEMAETIAEAKGDSRYGTSTFICEAIKFYRHFFSNRRKLVKYRESVNALLNTLP